MDHELDEDLIEDENIIINEKDGLPDIQPTEQDIADDLDITSLSLHNLDDDNGEIITSPKSDQFPADDLPKSLIVTNIHESVFNHEQDKTDIEALFREIDPNVTFLWLRSFRRLRVSYKSVCFFQPLKIRV